MSNYPDDCQHKKCPWDEVEAKECKYCPAILHEDDLESGTCKMCKDLYKQLESKQ